MNNCKKNYVPKVRVSSLITSSIIIHSHKIDGIFFHFIFSNYLHQSNTIELNFISDFRSCTEQIIQRTKWNILERWSVKQKNDENETVTVLSSRMIKFILKPEYLPSSHFFDNMSWIKISDPPGLRALHLQKFLIFPRLRSIHFIQRSRVYSLQLSFRDICKMYPTFHRQFTNYVQFYKPSSEKECYIKLKISPWDSVKMAKISYWRLNKYAAAIETRRDFWTQHLFRLNSLLNITSPG